MNNAQHAIDYRIHEEVKLAFYVGCTVLQLASVDYPIVHSELKRINQECRYITEHGADTFTTQRDLRIQLKSLLNLERDVIETRDEAIKNLSAIATDIQAVSDKLKALPPL